MNTIGIDEKGIFAYQAPMAPCEESCESTSFCFDTCAKRTGYDIVLKAALRDRVYFKDQDETNAILYGDLIKGKSYPVPDGYDVKINKNPAIKTRFGGCASDWCDTCNCEKYAILVPKEKGAGDDYPVINEYHSIAKTKDQIDSEIIAMVFPETIEEAVDKAWEEDARGRREPCNPIAFRYGFIAGAKSNAAKDYWYEQFKKEKL